MAFLDLAVKIFADDQASKDIPSIASNITGGLGKAVAGVAKIGAAATAAAAGAAVAIGSAAVSSYAEQEQLWGGVQKLYGAAGMTLEEYAQSVGQSVDEAKGKYDELRQAEGLVAQNAQQAFKTAGMSSNEYMENATQFSAALINSLGGDTVEAAKLTDVAMRAISDNVNTFGSDAEAVTNAIIGMSRGNYTMLDNMKLGYSGTAEGMLELINDSGVLCETLTDTSQLAEVGFDKMIEAVQAVQEQQGIAGTTAREAATTIEGSINMTKSAWANLLTELGKEDGDIPARMEELVDSAVTVLIGATDENGEKLSTGILGRVSTIVSNLSQAIPTMMPTIQAALSQAIPQVLQIITDTIPILLQLVGTVFMTLGTMLPTLFQTILPVVMEQVLMLINTLTQNMPMMFSAAGQLFGMITQAIVMYGPQILASLGNFLLTLIFTIINNVPNMLSAAGQLFMAIVTAIGEALPQVLDTAGQMLSDLWNKITSFDLSGAGSDLVQGLINGIGGAIGGVADALIGGLQSAVDSALSFLGIASPSKLFDWVGQMSMEGLAGGIEDTAAKAEKATEKAVQGVYGSASGTINADVSAAPANNQILDALNGIREGMNMSVYLDSTTLVGGIAPTMNTALGRL